MKQGQDTWFVRKDLRASEYQRQGAFPTVVVLTFHYLPDRKGARNVDEEGAVVCAFEADAIPRIEEEAGCVFVASVTSAEWHRNLFYVSDFAGFTQAITRYSGPLGVFRLSYSDRPDSAWVTYGQLPDGE